MNVMAASFTITTPPAPVQEAPPAHEAPDGASKAPAHARDPKTKQPDFHKTLHAQLNPPHAVIVPPWQANPFLASEEEATVQAGEAVGDRPKQPPMPFLPPMRPEVPELSLPEPKAKPPKPQELTPVQVLVEPGLPPVQPVRVHEPEKVPLVDFPQVVAGHVRKSSQNGQPLTQLDFEITPPALGPVNMQLSLQNGAVNVQLVALTTQARLALESQVSAIQSILQGQNLTAGEIKVVAPSSGKGGAGGAGRRGDQPGFGFFSGGRRRRPYEEGRASGV